MLPNTAMLRNLVDSGQHDDFLERETTKTATNSKGSSSKKKKKKKVHEEWQIVVLVQFDTGMIACMFVCECMSQKMLLQSSLYIC